MVVSRPNGEGSDRLARQGEHAAFVDAWLARAAKELSPEGVLQLFEAALAGLWARTSTTLGEVTLTAIADRVFYNASERFPAFSALKVGPTGAIPIADLRERISAEPTPDLLAGVRFVLVELLTVLGNLTAEILTPELHAELASIMSPEASRREPSPPSSPRHAVDAEGKKS